MTLFGTGLLALVAVAALTSAMLWELARRRDVERRVRVARWGGGIAVTAAAAAAVTMLASLIASPGTFAYAERTTEPGMPLYYRITSLWAGMEGSLILWLLATALVAAVFPAVSGRRLPLRTTAIAASVLNVATAAFAGVALTVHPFAPGAAGIAERPSPLLQDHPAMGLHPPLLYAGFTMLAVPYALTLAAAVGREWTPAWRDAVHRWTVAAWVPLTVGIVLGAWWSYAVLGWGGYWAWDPVENASLLPWLAATGLLHSIGRRTRIAAGTRWTVLFASLAYVLVLLATFLTRSGVVSSIHAFSVSPVGPALLVLLVIAVAAVVPALLPNRLPPGGQAPVRLTSLPLVINRWGASVVAAIVLAGSVLPTAVLSLWGEQVSVGPPWYERVLAPVAFVLLVVMAVSPWLGRRRRAAGSIVLPAVAAGLAAGVIGVSTRDGGLTVTGALAVFVVFGTASRAARRGLPDRSALGGALAHIGVAVAAVAVVAGGAAVVTERTVPVGGAVSADTTTAVLVGVDEETQTRRTVQSARLLVADGAGEVVELRPELRWYDEHGVVLAGPAIRTEPFRDVYVTLLSVDAAQGVATVRLAVQPLMSWLWAASALMVVGVAVAGWPRRPVSGSDERPSARPSPKFATSGGVRERL